MEACEALSVGRPGVRKNNLRGADRNVAYGVRGMLSLWTISLSNISAWTMVRGQDMSSGWIDGGQAPMRSARCSSLASSKAAGNSTLSALEDSMNPLHTLRTTCSAR